MSIRFDDIIKPAFPYIETPTPVSNVALPDVMIVLAYRTLYENEAAPR